MRNAFSASVLLLAAAVSSLSVASDLVITGGRIYTVNDSQPWAEAVAVSRGKIEFVGSREQAKTFITANTKVIDLEDGLLLPGFIDTHNHVFEGASKAGGNCLLSPYKTLKQQRSNLLECKAQIDNAGDWAIGYGHRLDALWGRGAGLNPRSYLDTLFPENPVIIMEESSHSMLVNSLALELAEIDRNSKHPPGGRIMFEQNGEPNGVLFDNAGDIVMERAWNSLTDNFQVSYEGLLAGMDEAVRHGITTIGDGRLYWRRDWFEVWKEAQKNNALVVRTSVRPWIYPEIEIDQQLGYLGEIQSDNHESLLIVDQVKMYIDGVMHFGTAKMLQPYDSSWQIDLPYGLNYVSPETLPQLLENLGQLGYGAHIHAVGDAGVRETLDAIEHVRKQGSEQLVSMTHLELVDSADIARFHDLNVHADFQAGAKFFAKTNWASSYIGNERAKRMLPMREIYETGANVSFSSDWTVNDINPLVAIANSVRFRKTKGLPDIHAAIKAATLNGAKALGLESVTGSIETGKSADFVVLDNNITELRAEDIEDTKVTMTILQGSVLFAARTQ